MLRRPSHNLSPDPDEEAYEFNTAAAAPMGLTGAEGTAFTLTALPCEQD